jgi:phosphatidate cytidylyltransferase
MIDKIKNLAIRALSGALFLAVMVSSILLGGEYYLIVFFLLNILGLREFYSLMNQKMEGAEVCTPLSILAGCVIYASVVLFCKDNAYDGFWLASGFVAISLIMIVELFRNKKNPVMNMALSLMGLLYVAVPFSLLTYVELVGEIGCQLVLSFFIVIWASDTGAYLVGMLFGKHKMFERISPKKTWEGFAGGLLFALLCGYIFSSTDFSPPYTLLSWISISFFIFIAGVLGDLVESMIKRNLGVKDSGSFMPGHGGLLDRFDSALIASPVLFLTSLLMCVF